jgi:hypothetical protein
MAQAASINPQTTAIPPRVPPVIAPPFEELPLPGLSGLTVGPGGLVKEVVLKMRVVFFADAVVLVLVVQLELVVAEVVNGASTLFEMKPMVEASRINPVEMSLPSLQHAPELFPQQKVPAEEHWNTSCS